ncbi:SpvB/TcaC N-terminal domain-containing protein [Pedobacter steynii]|uniref:RHS repeat-associated core domain-containing protein n=1 Tax=Pedobacter steynii TaxID=430522 RepID=A0A1D7QKW5_9SPHI|nr:SpvB/TcaC N-terminal domain-containing protein [Pedobacter steynii]AOM79321.1 hypothetical protein BFS30_20410 [Pedobacter steynii]
MTQLQDKPGISSQNETDVPSRMNTGQTTVANAIQIPKISLPKSGGALKGIDEKFQVNSSNGTASFSIPIPVSPSREGFQPALQLSYNSGIGNSSFGLGWNIDLPAIQRSTERKLPRYRDNDTFIISGAEDLVPILDANRELKVDVYGPYEVRSYRPRIEGLFAKIEQIQHKAESFSFWKVTTKDNTTTFYGTDSNSRIADPAKPERIFKWLPVLSFDDRGNCLTYSYQPEDLSNVPTILSEKNRMNGLVTITNRHLKQVSYGNRSPYYPNALSDPTNADALYSISMPVGGFMFELVFDYGEHTTNQCEASALWKARKDAYSDYRAGFEIRNYRQCERILMFHRFAELGTQPLLVRSLNFGYESPVKGTTQNTELSYLTSIIQTGFNTDGHSNSLPAITFEYEPLQWNTKINDISKEDLIHAPQGIGNNYQWVDFFGEGISGLLTEQAAAWHYKRNLGNGHFSNAAVISPKPSLMGIATGELSIQDLDNNGKKYIVSQSQELKGYFEQTDTDEWLPFKPFPQTPNLNNNDPNVKFLDLNGDGIPELVLSEEQMFIWFPSMGTAGFDSPEFTPKPVDEDKGPAIVFSDPEQCIYLADMNGDGLTDILRIKNESICYWPNLGYGNFGPKVSLDNVKNFDHPDRFNPDYLHLFDVSGTGTTDIIYLGKHRFKAYINLSGNALSDPFEIDPFWDVTHPNQVSVMDLLGKGTGCIVWSSPLPANAGTPMQYIDLVNGRKPHLMIKHRNGMGKETAISYKSSVEYYLEDTKNNKPWATKLPFPVQCVSKVEIVDLTSELRFATKYRYRHGYYDQQEREFRGFGLVEQEDTEEYGYLKKQQAANAPDILFHEAPILSRSWYHTGAFLLEKKILDHFEKDYWYNDPVFAGKQLNEERLPDAEIPEQLSIEELREAYRACKGMLLRQETFALDGSEKEKIPYTVSFSNCHIKLLQEKAGNEHAVFIAHQSESLSYQYERNPEDPRIGHSLNLEIDGFGNVLKSLAVVYGRKDEAATAAVNLMNLSLKTHKDFIKTAQTQTHIIYTETKMTTDALEKHNNKQLIYYRTPASYSVKTHEATGFSKSKTLYQITDFEALLSGNVTLKDNHEQIVAAEGPCLRRLGETAALLLSYDLETPLPLGKHGALGINFESYQLAYTPELLDLRFNTDANGLTLNPKRVDGAMMSNCGYVERAGSWWIRSGTVQFFDRNLGESPETAAQQFYQPISFKDPFNQVTKVSYPANKTFLFTEKTIDEMGNESSITEFDYRVLSARTIKDVNDNISQASFDALGMVSGMALLGKGAQADDLIDFKSDLTAEEISGFFNDPLTTGRQLLKNATSRSIYDYSSFPLKKGNITRETHVRNDDGSLNPEAPLQYAFEYTGGMGNMLLEKVRAEAGKALKIENGTVRSVMADPRWLGNGRTILNNKGNPIKTYEPYFSTTHLYEDETSLRETGVTPVLHYDASGRMLRTDFPDGTISRMEYDSWQQKVFDQNDTVAEADCEWRLKRENPDILFLQQLQEYGGDIDKEKEALTKTMVHANTPAILITDSLGRSFCTIVQNKWEVTETLTPTKTFEEFYVTRMVLDIEGRTHKVIDARDNEVIAYAYNMLGQQVNIQSMDSGNRLMLDNSLGKSAFVWDNRNYRFETVYDLLHRPVMSKVQKEGQTFIFDKITYGSDKLKNENGVPVVHYDTAGVSRKLEIDFKGTVRQSSMQFCAKLEEFPDWDDLSKEVFLSSAKFDALGRAVESRSPHDPSNPLHKPSIVKPVYNEGNLLNQVLLKLKQEPEKAFVTGITHDARGQRSKITYGNETYSQYTYDPATFRLRRLQTKSAAGHLFQDLTYTYDPCGHVIHIEDKAQQSLFFSNAFVQPVNSYRYDASYRLIEARGREHIGQGKAGNSYDRHRMFNDSIPAGNHALRNYAERYQYDAVGNLRELKHTAANGGNWTRQFNNAEHNNRLISTKIGATSEGSNYTYDEHGSILSMPHLTSMSWNFQDQLQRIQIQSGADNDLSDGAFYSYDSSGQRVRKVVTKGDIKEERIYLNGFEIFRKKRGNLVLMERESLHVVDDKSRIALIESLTVTPPESTEDKVRCRYQYSNHLGSAGLELTDEAAPRVISYEEYHPYGTTAYQNLNKDIKAAAKRYRYTGMERDEETGLNYHGARYYAAWLCRWTAADPIGPGDGVNVYIYCRANPAGGNDPSGTQCNGLTSCPDQTLSSKSLELEGKASSTMARQVDELNAENASAMEALRTSPPAAPFDTKKWQADVSQALKKTESPGYKANFSLSLLQSRGIPENRTFWNRGGGGLMMGGTAAVLGIGGIFTGGGTWFLLGAGMLTAGGVATTSVSAVQLGTSYSGKTSYQQDLEVSAATSKTLMLSNPAALLGGSLAMPFYKNPEEGLETGAAAGSMLDFGLSLSTRAAVYAYLKNPVKRFTVSLGVEAPLMPVPIFRSDLEMRARDIQYRLYTSGTLSFTQATRYTSASVIDVGDAWIITHTNKNAWQALNSGQFYLRSYEVVGPAPMKLLGKTVHSEMLGRDYAIAVGYTSGLIGTYPRGCYGCQTVLKETPLFRHLNPRP